MNKEANEFKPATLESLCEERAKQVVKKVLDHKSPFEAAAKMRKDKVEEMQEIEANQGMCSIKGYDWLQWEVFQPGNKVHENLVFGLWLRHIKSFNEYKRMSKPEFQNERRLIGDVVKRCPPTLLKSRKGEPYFGFICPEIQQADYGDMQVLHFMYIRNAWRRRGLANLLMKLSFTGKFKKDTIFYSYPMRAATHLAEKWLLRKKRNAIFYEVKDGK